MNEDMKALHEKLDKLQATVEWVANNMKMKQLHNPNNDPGYNTVDRSVIGGGYYCK